MKECKHCDREATHAIKYRTPKYWIESKVCVHCLEAIEAGMEAAQRPDKDVKVLATE